MNEGMSDEDGAVAIELEARTEERKPNFPVLTRIVDAVNRLGPASHDGPVSAGTVLEFD